MSMLTPDARRALSLARKEAEVANHGAISPKHLLWAVVDLDHGNAARILRRLGTNLQFLKETLESTYLPVAPSTIVYSLRVKRALLLAAKSSRALGSPSIGVEHLLLGLIREESGQDRTVFKRFRIDHERVMRELCRLPLAAPSSSEVDRGLIHHETSSETIHAEKAGAPIESRKFGVFNPGLTPGMQARPSLEGPGKKELPDVSPPTTSEEASSRSESSREGLLRDHSPSLPPAQ